MFFPILSFNTCSLKSRVLIVRIERLDFVADCLVRQIAISKRDKLLDSTAKVSSANVVIAFALRSVQPVGMRSR